MPTAISTIRGVFQAMGVLPCDKPGNDVKDSKNLSRLRPQVRSRRRCGGARLKGARSCPEVSSALSRRRLGQK